MAITPGQEGLISGLAVERGRTASCVRQRAAMSRRGGQRGPLGRGCRHGCIGCEHERVRPTRLAAPEPRGAPPHAAVERGQRGLGGPGSPVPASPPGHRLRGGRDSATRTSDFLMPAHVSCLAPSCLLHGACTRALPTRDFRPALSPWHEVSARGRGRGSRSVAGAGIGSWAWSILTVLPGAGAARPLRHGWAPRCSRVERCQSC